MLIFSSYPELENDRRTAETSFFFNVNFYSWFARDVTKILKSKPGGLQNFYLLLMKDYLKIYLFTIP